jgi:hypothetical protein
LPVSASRQQPYSTYAENEQSIRKIQPNLLKNS